MIVTVIANVVVTDTNIIIVIVLLMYRYCHYYCYQCCYCHCCYHHFCTDTATVLLLLLHVVNEHPVLMVTITPCLGIYCYCFTCWLMSRAPNSISMDYTLIVFLLIIDLFWTLLLTTTTPLWICTRGHIITLLLCWQ